MKTDETPGKYEVEPEEVSDAMEMLGKGYNVCEWKQMDDWDNSSVWKTSCDQAFHIEEGTPEDNNMKFCCYCGKELKQIIYIAEEEEE